MTGVRRVSCLAILTATLAVVSLPGASSRVAAASRPIAETDLFAFVWAADPQISPDGRQVAFVRVAVNDKKEGYDTALWLVETTGQAQPRPLTAGPRDLSPRWSPDGRSLAFLRALEKDGKPQPPQLFSLSMEGGEARALTDVPRPVGGPVWSPDGTRLAFTSTLSPDDLQKKAEPAARKSDVRVITKAIYRANGAGYRDTSRRSALWTVAAGPGVPGPGVPGPGVEGPTRVTDEPFDVGVPAWAPDGTALFFSATPADEAYYALPDADLFKVPAAGGRVERVASIEGGIGTPVISPDGARVAFRGVAIDRHVRSYYQPDLFVHTLGAAESPRNLTARYDFDVAGGLSGDQRAPRGSQPNDPVWAADGRAVFVTTTDKGVESLQRVDAETGATTPVTRAQEEVIAFTSNRDRTAAVILVSTPTLIGDLERLDLASGTRTRLTRLNETLFSGLTLTPPEEVWFNSFDGRRVQTWVQKPPDFDPTKKYPDAKDFASRSAITFVDRVKTPLMLIEGEQDLRTPPAAGGEQMFRALKYRKIPTVMVQFSGESPELSRSGQPWHRIERLQHIVSWFDKYLQGKKVGTYDEN